MVVRLIVLCVLAAACGDGDGDAGSASDDGAPPVACDGEPEHAGEGTYYDADGTGNCSFDATGDPMVAAMNQIDYDGSAACGACAAVDGPEGSVTVRIVDRCPGCPQGDIDMSPQAFERIAPLSAGRVPISWAVRRMRCGRPHPLPVQGGQQPVLDRHAGAQPPPRDRLARCPTGRRRMAAGRARELQLLRRGRRLGEGPIDLRVTDVHGETIEDAAISPGDATEVAGASQFPDCTALSSSGAAALR